jgi:hypothetical protein
MAILSNLPENFAVETPTSITLNIADLATLVNSLTADAFWEDSDNWESVRFVMKNDSSQSADIVFLLANSNSSTVELHPLYRSGVVECKKIVITDFCGSSFIIKRSEFTTADEFDFTITGGWQVSPGTGITWDNTQGGGWHTLGANGAVTFINGGWSNNVVWSNASAINNTNDFTLTYNVQTSSQREFICGVSTDGNINAANGYLEVNYGIYVDSSGAVYATIAGNNVAQNLSTTISTNTAHELKLQKVGTDLKLYVNNVLKHTVSGYNFSSNKPIVGTPYPSVVLLSAYKA